MAQCEHTRGNTKTIVGEARSTRANSVAVINAEESLAAAFSGSRIGTVAGELGDPGVGSVWGQLCTSLSNLFRYFGSPCPLHLTFNGPMIVFGLGAFLERGP